MEWWKKLSPQQRKLIAIGVPVVAIFALVTVLRRGGSAPADDGAAPPTGMLAPVAAPNTDAIGVGQLASFEDAVTQDLDELWRRVEDRITTTAPDPAPTTQAPTPALPEGRFTIDAAPARTGIYAVNDQAARVSVDSSTGQAVARSLDEYGSAAGAAAVIDTMADFEFVARARGATTAAKRRETARLVLGGSFGPVTESFKPTLQRIASSDA